MSNKHFFPTIGHFYKWVAGLSDKFEQNKSQFVGKFNFCTVDGKLHKCGSALEMFNAMNYTLGTTIDPRASYETYGKYYITDGFDGVVSPTAVTGTPPERPPVKKVMDEVVEEPAVASSVASSDVVATSEYLSFNKVDWPRVEALKSNKDDKLWLDEYAAKFGVELKRNKTVENMIADFKEAAGV